jgi:hypothetical protein
MGARAAVLLLSLTLCKAPEPALTEYVHPTTHFTLRAPTTVRVGESEIPLFVTQSPTGFRLASTTPLRQQVAVEADVDPATAAPTGPWPDLRRFGERAVHYRVDELEAGMGGTEFSLVAWEPCKGGHVVYRQSETVEAPARPSFSLAWMVIEHAGVP